jgi:hypothetical protein
MFSPAPPKADRQVVVIYSPAICVPMLSEAKSRLVGINREIYTVIKKGQDNRINMPQRLKGTKKNLTADLGQFICNLFVEDVFHGKGYVQDNYHGDFKVWLAPLLKHKDKFQVSLLFHFFVLYSRQFYSPSQTTYGTIPLACDRHNPHELHQ